ncbi:unnamed protein product [Protopolystoma xenopodis]|uniref:Uncharacterized protein n=1 Tax=Protopolystoma xenopodis TaxID=117903 RepID=A0A448X6Q5_9PLAT|nr:unnamed protein product [Protopolystoma xenopodis]
MREHLASTLQPTASAASEAKPNSSHTGHSINDWDELTSLMLTTAEGLSLPVERVIEDLLLPILSCSRTNEELENEVGRSNFRDHYLPSNTPSKRMPYYWT